ncbi:hypothetical protein HOLleu_38795 [Holothuria leucospilota]|uniref:Uncharacterized protein n=1 Tax=Holothuria leucospilota TaxID=206669 RepID=A0A9Q0YHG4_HOLLE|nr:hypothetical protein HOLleu_38795 [Holothuria leucospilota]
MLHVIRSIYFVDIQVSTLNNTTRTQENIDTPETDDGFTSTFTVGTAAPCIGDTFALSPEAPHGFTILPSRNSSLHVTCVRF